MYYARIFEESKGTKRLLIIHNFIYKWVHSIVPYNLRIMAKRSANQMKTTAIFVLHFVYV